MDNNTHNKTGFQSLEGLKFMQVDIEEHRRELVYHFTENSSTLTEFSDEVLIAEDFVLFRSRVFNMICFRSGRPKLLKVWPR